MGDPRYAAPRARDAYDRPHRGPLFEDRVLESDRDRRGSYRPAHLQSQNLDYDGHALRNVREDPPTQGDMSVSDYIAVFNLYRLRYGSMKKDF